MSEPLSLAEALDRLRDPRASESWSAVGPGCVLLVDVAGDAEDDGHAAERLRALPCPTIAWRADAASPAGARLLPAFDVRASSEAELAPVVEATQHCPQATAMLVQLLRHSQELEIHDGLVAESLAYSTLQAGPEFAGWLAARDAVTPAPPAVGPAVLAERGDGVLRLILNRPARHNAFSAEMRDGLCEALAVALADPSIAEVVLSGAGPSFSSGGELAEFGTLTDPATAHAVRSARNASRLLAECAERVTAHVHGACVGAGVELPAFARRVVARPDAWFQLPEVAMGLVPGAGGTVSIPRRIGRQRTAWLALSGVRIDAETALSWGLIDEIS